MEALELMTSRRSTRKFQQRPLEAKKLDMILKAGRHAPSGGNCQTTHFLVIQNKEVLDKLTVMVREAFAKMEETPGMYKSIVNSIRLSKGGKYVFHYDPSVLIVTANLKEYGNNIADCSCALENMMLEANALELGSCWINQLKWLNEEPTVLAYLQSLGLKEGERVYGALAVGYADTKDGLPARNPLPRTGNEVTYI
ncbi:MAG: nitroreductase [Clostridiales bacterium]|nr:nitroreductase [Candidatus Blautia equi]